MPKIDLLPCPFCGKLETLRMLYIPLVNERFAKKEVIPWQQPSDSASVTCANVTT